MTISVALVATAFNTFAARRLPMFEGMVLYLHILLWFGVCDRNATTLNQSMSANINSSTFRLGSLRPKYQLLKCLATSRIGADGRRWVRL